MTFELLPHAAWFAAGFIGLAAMAGILAISMLVSFFVSNHEVRVARNQSIPTYYRRLALSH
ncbi:hypothetical protein ncot_05115 [Nocardioides sp. JQ2195]|uniref:hypothetical protein n=1 Tax=Nocardioides sp. JQ2195 TaxID=2592334 RepID=UPI00143EBDA3|nr:hypothetical protein [Nocardioides sp. JQ2195]QIX26049.1 hypothetical protein ncot_05115 [Nocardioides sp. JQ2195]